jgi:hypothetical protein
MRSETTTLWQNTEEIEAQAVVLGLLAQRITGQQQSCDTRATNAHPVSDAELDILHFDQSPLSPSSSQYLLKETLLLCLAQLFACFDIPHFVSCAALGNKHRATTVFITRNNGFQERDFAFRTSLCNSVTAITQRKLDILKSPTEMIWLK